MTPNEAFQLLREEKAILSLPVNSETRVFITRLSDKKTIGIRNEMNRIEKIKMTF